MKAPRCIIIAGPNGAGKTTFARSYLVQDAGIENFVNADCIAMGLSPLKPERAARHAGRLLLEELDRLTAGRESFALASTLSGMTYVERIERMRQAGYHIEIIFLQLNSASLAIKRVAHRVKHGGHDVPDSDVRRRYERGQRNFKQYYKDLSDSWAVYDNSGPTTVLKQPTPMSKNQKQIEQDEWIAGITRALKRADKEAHRVARMHGTKVWVIKDGKIVGLEP